ncbi:hypothetical protein AYO20_09076 [Fonsecaea nubica]|uniref:Major facilitator superfamily (MFS) profile domain-containing protein n=1 Tax=Fonsecaea nubica TaxID=856822 RepID=A0A178CKD1_9EURO|nr:hypothetical protein AYO20_09076 [Fonsecaea nubica]OAL29784.1 hypothetical protein AYO20_09076 [Fonsecaea nubica]
MAVVKFGPRTSMILAFLTASFSIAILSYDASMVNNLNINATYLERNAGAVVTGPFLGAWIDKWGRIKSIACGNLLVILGVILQASAESWAQFIVGRFFIGVATTVAATAVPMWIAELSPPKTRQLISGLVMCAVPFTAILVCFIVMGIYDAGSDWAWRGAVLGEATGPLLGLCLLPFVDESPRWLVSKGQTEKAGEIITRLHARGNAQSEIVEVELKEIIDTLEYESSHGGTWKDLLSPAPNRRRFIIAVLTNIFYQIVGANMILYFLSFVIFSAGVTDIWNTLLINMGLIIWQFLVSLFGVFSIHRLGRRPSLITGTAGIIVCLVLMSILVERGQTTGGIRFGIGALVIVGVFIFFASTSWMILAYTYPPEILKFSQRGKGVAASQAIGFAISFINLYTSPIALEKIQWKYYAITAGWDTVILIVIIALFKETKGKTLEQIDEIFEHVTHSDHSVMEVLNGHTISPQVSAGQNGKDQGLKSKMGQVSVTATDA